MPERKEPPARRPLTMIPYRDIPIIINSFNRLSSLRRLVDWLLRAGHSNIVILDNASAYPPLLAYLDSLGADPAIRVIRLPGNYGPRALWTGNLLKHLNIDTEYVYSDPDVVPADFCPPDAVAMLQQILDSEAHISKAGLGLRLDDIPVAYKPRKAVIAWERQFWLRPAARGLFLAGVDTTFALYPPHAPHAFGPANIRTGWPYLAAHEGWYGDSNAPSAEDRFYAAATLPAASNWSVTQPPGWLIEAAERVAANHPRVIYIGPERELPPGYLSIGNNGPNTQLPLPDDWADGVYGCDMFDRVANAAQLMEELYRVAKNGAKFLLHLSCAPAGDLYTGNWEPERIMLAVSPEMKGADEADIRRHIEMDPAVVIETIIHLRAIKPMRDKGSAMPNRPQPEIVFSRIDMSPGFTRV